ncbi:UNVERIFIED_CONTAM: hypothetical protein K2H54_066925 [Gekko kuhli]
MGGSADLSLLPPPPAEAGWGRGQAAPLPSRPSVFVALVLKESRVGARKRGARGVGEDWKEQVCISAPRLRLPEKWLPVGGVQALQRKIPALARVGQAKQLSLPPRGETHSLPPRDRRLASPLPV